SNFSRGSGRLARSGYLAAWMDSSSSSMSSRLSVIRRCWACSTTSVIASLTVSTGSSTIRGRVGGGLAGAVGRNSSSEPVSEARLNLLMGTSRVVAVQDRVSELAVGLGALRGAGVLEDGHRRQRGLGESNRVLDREVVDQLAEGLPHQLEDLL